jgi:hypothetical protein
MWWSFRRYEACEAVMTAATWRIPGTRNTWPVVLNWTHGWKSTGHGPRSWPWWRMISIKVYDCGVQKPSTTTRIWYYTRWVCGHFDLSIDRRVRGKYSGV